LECFSQAVEADVLSHRSELGALTEMADSITQATDDRRPTRSAAQLNTKYQSLQTSVQVRILFIQIIQNLDLQLWYSLIPPQQIQILNNLNRHKGHLAIELTSG